MGKQFFLWLVPSSRYLSSRRLVRLDVWRGTGGDLLTHNFIFVLLQICENIPLCIVNVTWQWSKSQTEMKGAWPPMSRGEEREGETAMLEEEPRLRSRVSRAQRIWFVGPHPGPQVVTERPMCPHLMYYSLRPPKHRWSPIAKLETNVWWFS